VIAPDYNGRQKIVDCCPLTSLLGVDPRKMSCDLERIYGELAARLPEDNASEPFQLDESVIPPAPQELTTDQVRIFRGQLQRLPGCRGDYLDVVAPRSTIRQLGLLLLSVLFHEQCERSTLHLSQPESVVKHIVTEYKHWSKSQVSGFWLRPWVLGYVPEDVNHAFRTDEVGLSAPLLRLTNLSDCQHDENEWRNRDVLHWAGGRTASAEIAEFLLNAGRNGATWKSFTIPANGAFFTAEVKVWIHEHWEDTRRRLNGARERSKQNSVR